MSDQQGFSSNGGDHGAVGDTVKDPVKEATAQVKAAAGQAAVKAKALYGEAKATAEERAEQARALVVERPYAAVGVALLVGVLLGHALSASRPQVIYLRDKRTI